MTSVKTVIKECQTYAKKHGFCLNPDKKALESVVLGLLENEKKYGRRYCPCRRISGNMKEDKPKICPCSYHKQEIQKDGRCRCFLFFKA